MNSKEFTPQVQEIRDYIKDLLEYLDGRGIILEDEDLVDEALDSLGSFPRLREIFELYQNDISEIETWECEVCGTDCSATTCTGNEDEREYTYCQNCQREISWELYRKNTGLCFVCIDVIN